jgi:hypothetical protein
MVPWSDLYAIGYQPYANLASLASENFLSSRRSGFFRNLLAFLYFSTMKDRSRILQNRQGMVLMSSLTLLSVLMVAGIGAGVMLQNDFRVLSNLRGGTEAFYFSVSGLEWAKSEIARATSFPPIPANQSKSFSAGQFTVSFLSSTVTGPLAARVTVHSTGTRGGAQNALRAQLTKSYDLADAALVLRGSVADVGISPSDAIFISGADHDPTTGNPTGAKSRSSVSIADDTARGVVMQALGTPPREGVLYEGADTAAAATSGYLPTTLITQLANDLCASATTVHAVPPVGSLVIENQSWGNPGAPQLHCIEGLSAPGDAATIVGNFTGAGILVVKNADLVLSGAFRWEGLVLVTGADVSFKTTDTATKELLGAALVNETGVPVTGRKILDIQGALRMLFSRQALDRASAMIPPATANIAYESLPSVILQDYWRTVTP